ncbi:MAG: DUF2071 domain-containing protein [Spirosomataceae bacterium]
MSKPIFLTARWENLLMANYEVSPQLLQPLLPPHTELDLFRGKCYVSLVGFMFLNTKVLGIPVPFHRNFEEVNLRFYVRHRHQNEWRRGVVFVKEIVPKWAISWVANTIYGEPYVCLPMSHQILHTPTALSVTYGWEYQQTPFQMSAKAEPKAVEMATDSEEEFITEHYWGYTRRSDSRTDEYGVEHPRWEVYPVNDYQINVAFGKLYGRSFSFLNQQRPDSVLLAKGSDIVVRQGSRLE